MSRAHLISARPPRAAADRVAAGHRDRFWGRERELALFRSLATDEAASVAVIYVHGIGGVGKSALLRECASHAARAGLTTIQLDGRLIDPSPAGFLLALGGVLGVGATESPIEYLGERDRVVLMVDSYELLWPLDPWLRQVFLPLLPARGLVVLAGRKPPSSEWTTDLDWRPSLRTIPLRNLSPGESRSLLAERGVPDARHGEILDFTHGHPLALVLVADLLAGASGEAGFNPGRTPNVVGALLERLRADAPDAAHWHALELSAHVRVTTRPLLAAAIDGADPHALFQWLRALSFIEESPEGLVPHDVAREAVDADFRWRDPDGYRSLHRRVWEYLRAQLRSTSGRRQQRAFFDKLFLHRRNPIGAQYHDHGTLGTIYSAPAAAADCPAMLDIVTRHEGQESANVAAYWMARQPSGFQLIRDVRGGLLGFVATLEIQNPAPEDMAIDPAIRSAWELIRRRGPLRAGEQVVHHRFHMADDGYQALSPIVNLLAMSVTLAPLRYSRLAWSVIAFANPDAWLPIMQYINFDGADEAAFTIGGRRYGLFAHDWRTESFDAWWEREAECSLGEEADAGGVSCSRAPLIVMSEPEFDESVRRALRDYAHPSGLALNPLVRSRVVMDAAGDELPARALQKLLDTAVDHLKRSERHEKFYRALLHTYLQPAPSQERAAERLGLPLSTYRYHLSRGTRQVVDWLWRRELYGPE